MNKIFLIIVILTVKINFLSAQTIDEIVSKHLHALGGETKLREIKSMEMDNLIKIQGLEMVNKTSIWVNSAVRSDSKVMGNALIQCYDGSLVWENIPVMMGGSGKPSLMAEDAAGSVINQADPFPMLDYKNKGTIIVLLDSDQESYHVKITPKKGAVSEIWINAESGLVSKLKTFQNGQDIEISFSSYTEIEGITFAMHMETMAGMIKIDTKAVKLNSDIDMAIFKMPGVN